MSEGLLTVVSVVEVFVLVLVLAVYLLAVARGLRSITRTLAEVAWGARAVERQLRAVESNIGHINHVLADIASFMPGVVRMAEQRARTGARV